MFNFFYKLSNKDTKYVNWQGYLIYDDVVILLSGTSSGTGLTWSVV